ncbi:hypothetical protein [Oxalicibacterium faecigallinarum]|uniref:Uncharacterized protein n=1 Tax=Oxalicibacterium faecigallinarum TaxID=573741 RepID=A0A8J3F105_9BURK|nr:hypothetical protein [Oxalicibacterium faecigallinarum]GGI16897.1 hypothetical protein GCM10008066_06260 [Oxalicibacterium faecigallinarum]
MGRSSSSSQANQTTQTSSYDNRIVTESGIVAAGGSSIVANIESMDGDIVKAALNFATDASDDNSANLGKLIEFGTKLFTTGADMLQTGQQTALAAMASAENDKRGAIDQKTVVVLGIAAAAALVMTKGKF